MSEWWKIWPNGLPNAGRLRKSGHRMAAEGMRFPWRWDGGTSSTNLDVIWGMSDYTEGGPFALSGPRPVGQGPHSTATALPATGPAIAPSAPGVAFSFCSCTVAMLSWGRGDGHTGGGFVDYQWSSGHGRKQKGAWALTGLGHGLINWCCEWRCPLYPRKQTFGREPQNVC